MWWQFQKNRTELKLHFINGLHLFALQKLKQLRIWTSQLLKREGNTFLVTQQRRTLKRHSSCVFLCNSFKGSYRVGSQDVLGLCAWKNGFQVWNDCSNSTISLICNAHALPDDVSHSTTTAINTQSANSLKESEPFMCILFCWTLLIFHILFLILFVS